MSVSIPKSCPMESRGFLREWLCCILLFACSKGFAGVTIITHGFNSDASDWVTAMGEAVAEYPNLVLTNSTRYEIFFQQNTQGEYVPSQRKLAGGDPKIADSGEII